jgi:hypothetical protein
MTLAPMSARLASAVCLAASLAATGHAAPGETRPSGEAEPPGAAAGAGAVALVAAVAGTPQGCPLGSAPCAEAQRVALAPFAWLAEGSRLELDAGSSLTALFLSGRRFEVRGPLHAAVLADAVAAVGSTAAGAIRELPAAGPPEVMPIAPGELPAPQLGAIRIRGGEIAGLYPNERATALATATTLTFRPVATASRYAVSVLDGRGVKVFETQTSAAALAVPSGILRLGEEYLWQVSTLDHPGGVLRGEAELRTLDGEAARAREALRARLAAAGDAASLVVLAEVDRRLGLLAEARDELAAAAALAPGVTALEAATEALREATGTEQR